MTTTLPLPPASSTEEEPKARKRHVGNNNSTTKDRTTLQKKQTARMSVRQSILKQNKQELRDQRRIAKLALQSQSPLQKFHMALLLNALALCVGAILFLKPEFFFGFLKKTSTNQWPPHHLAVLYPPQLSPRKDVPLFFQQYAIATEHNAEARQAMKKLMDLRRQLKPFQIGVFGWERGRMMELYPVDEYCGSGFAETYRQTQSIRHAEDMLYWCLLYTYQNDGFLYWNTTVERSPISLKKNSHSEEDTLKGMVPKLVGHDRIHPSFLWLPKKRERKQVPQKDGETTTKSVSTFDMNSQLPAKMLPWLIQTAPTVDYPTAVEEYLYQLVMEEKEHWTLLDAVCDDERELHAQFNGHKVMGKDCLEGRQGCCTVYLPKEPESNRTKGLKQIYGEEYHSSSDSED